MHETITIEEFSQSMTIILWELLVFMKIYSIARLLTPIKVNHSKLTHVKKEKQNHPKRKPQLNRLYPQIPISSQQAY